MAVNVLFQAPVVRRERHFRGFNPLQREFTDEELRQRYRFGRETIQYLSDLMRADLERGTNKETALTVEQQILIALRFYGSGSQLQVVGDTMGLDKSTVSRVIDRVTEALVDRKDQYISWPDNHRKNIIRSGFYEKADFPNVVGCIDGTHIRITGPSVDEPAFVNRKAFHSINVQAICDHEGRFTNISARWPGSAHDSHVFRTSAIGRHLENGYQGIGQGVLLGDSGYPCRQFLLTPYRQPAGRGQERFNRRHCSTRSTIERTFGIWKKRFHILGSEIACGKLNSFLVRIDSPSEQAFVQNLINTSRSQHDFWIGAEDVFSEGTWEWFGTKLKLAYTNWCPNEPNDALKGEDCAAINVNMNPVTNFCWNDYDCNTYHNFVCEKREQPAYKTTRKPEIHNTSPNLIWRTIA